MTVILIGSTLERAPDKRSAAPGLTWARIGHGGLQLATCGRIRQHTGMGKQDHEGRAFPQVRCIGAGLSHSGAGEARTHDRRIMRTLTRLPGFATCADVSPAAPGFPLRGRFAGSPLARPGQHDSPGVPESITLSYMTT